MQIFIILNILKVVLWSIIIYLAYNYIDLNQDFLMWVLIMWLWIFISLWWVSFFILLWIFYLLDKKNIKQATLKAYKYTWLLALYVLTNFLLLSFNFWSKTIAIILLICFAILWAIL
jgi:hypothetical protein